jgi:hypothetical protein
MSKLRYVFSKSGADSLRHVAAPGDGRAPAARRGRRDVPRAGWFFLDKIFGGRKVKFVKWKNTPEIVPTFNDPNDRVALGILGELFRDRPVVGIHAVDLVWGFGSLHCLTQQQPV